VEALSLGAIVGLLLGFATVAFAMIFKHIPFTALLQPAAFIVIFGGTIASVMMAMPEHDLKNFGTLLGIIFGKDKNPPKGEVARRIVDYATKSRQNGLLTLESSISSEPYPFLARCLSLLVDGTNTGDIEEAIAADIEAMQERHAGTASLFSQAGTYAPTLGVLGAVMGLIAALGDLSDTDALSAAISAAFIATVLGIFTGYVMWNPMANRLKRKSNMEVQLKHMILQGICDISSGKNPGTVQENLMAHLTGAEQKKIGLSGRR
jgi:chemotaxis protein MotA